jgi:hypothetical protein
VEKNFNTFQIKLFLGFTFLKKVFYFAPLFLKVEKVDKNEIKYNKDIIIILYN